MREPHTISLQNETGFNALFNHAPIGILVINREGYIELANPTIEKLFSYTNAELRGQQVETLIPTIFEKYPEYPAKDYTDEPLVRHMELFARKKNRSEFPVEVILEYHPDSAGKSVIAFVTDITERKYFSVELEKKAKERTLELTAPMQHEKEMHEIKLRFFSMALHEFRTPLNTILSSVSFMEAYSIGEKGKKHLERIRSSAKSVTNILNDILFLDSLEQGHVKIKKSSFNLSRFAMDVIQEINSTLKEGQCIHFSHNGEKNIVQDKKILRNLFHNILCNVSSYSGENTEIDFLTEVSNTIVSINVKNHKTGIQGEECHRLLGKNFRYTSAANIQGTDIGPHIIKRYVELLGGRGSFKCKTNKGAACMIELPQIQ